MVQSKYRSARRCTRFLFIVMAAFLLSACGEHQNEGASDFRIFGIDAKPVNGAVTNRIRGRYLMSGSPEIQPYRIQKGEALSISLVSAYICDFREGFFADFLSSGNSGALPCPNQPGGSKGTLNFQGASTRGEIGIIANVFERTKGTSISYDPADAEKNGRVIFYTEDVRETGQLLNLSKLPIYGPKTYGGKPFFMTFSILEFDNEENERFRALLKKLANVGKTAYPPSAPVLGVLNSLGSALLSGNQNDTEFRYHMEFDPPNTVSKLATDAGLTEGYYAFVREERRDLDTPWRKINYDEKSGWLQKDQKNYRDRSWFVVRIRREDPDSAIDQDVGELLSEFVKRRKVYNNQNIAAVAAEFQSLISTIEQTRTLATAKGHLAVLNAKQETAAKKQKAKKDIAALLCNAAMKSQGPKATLTPGQLGQLLDQINQGGQTKPALQLSDLGGGTCANTVAAKFK